MSLKTMVVVVLVTTSLLTGSALPANEPPHVDAGLDQTVPVHSTVLLDGSGTRDPDGDVTAYEWEIETPNGTTVTPACPSCVRTRFDVTQTGTYTIQLAATDDDGATGTDTLYVTVTADDDPSIRLDGPARTNTTTLATYTATPIPGSEPITNLTWTVNGTERTGFNDTELERTFSTPGEKTITVTATDAIGRTATATHVTTVTNATISPGDGNSTPPDDPTVTPLPGPVDPPENETESNETGPIADQYDPSIGGPQLVLGSEPLTGNYTLTNRPPAANISSVEWIINGNLETTALGIRTRWSPGDHDLEAMLHYDDGSTDTATFEDGSTTVTADPAPRPSLSTASIDADSLSGAFLVTDEYSNLQSVHATVENVTVFSGRYPPRLHEQPTTVDDDYTFDDIEPGTNYTITLTATDARGQTRTTTRTIRANEGPEIISAEFVNTPVDSYHPRLDPDRYTAKHVIKIDLNGADPTSVRVRYSPKKRGMKRLGARSRTYSESDDILKLYSDWAGQSPSLYNITSHVVYKNSRLKNTTADFEVTSSPPELRLTSVSDGTQQMYDDWGKIVDASESFDPDGTPLEFEWHWGANATTPEGPVAKLNPTRRAGIRITDKSNEYTEENGSFLDYYIPNVNSVEPLEDGPFNASEDVKLDIITDRYSFIKNISTYNITLAARSNSSTVEIKSVRRERIHPSDVDGKTDRKSRIYRYVATVTVPARALNESDNWVTLYNVENPDRITQPTELGDVEIRFSREKENLRIDEVVYKVENDSGIRYRKVSDRKTADRMTSDEWSVDEKTKVIDSVEIERRTEEPVREKGVRHVDTRREAVMLAQSKDGWSYGGSQTQTKTVQDTEPRWVSDRTTGRFTGRTRQSLQNPDAYRTERQYKYTTRETVEKWVSVTKEIEQTVERIRTVKREVCPRNLGCFEEIVHERYTTTETVEREISKRVTETRTVTHKYWAKGNRHPSHHATGATRRVRTEPKKYTTEYQILVPTERTVTETTYVVNTVETKTRDTWEYDTEVPSMERARSLAQADDKRIGDVSRNTEWLLAKNTTVEEMVEEYDDEENVLTTYATVSGTLVYGPNGESTRPFTIQLEFNGTVAEREIIEAAEDVKLTCTDTEEHCYA